MAIFSEWAPHSVWAVVRIEAAVRVDDDARAALRHPADAGVQAHDAEVGAGVRARGRRALRRRRGAARAGAASPPDPPQPAAASAAVATAITEPRTAGLLVARIWRAAPFLRLGRS